jgi:hypothetical protein
MYVRARRQAYDERMGRCKAFLAEAVLTSGEEGWCARSRRAGIPQVVFTQSTFTMCLAYVHILTHIGLPCVHVRCLL